MRTRKGCVPKAVMQRAFDATTDLVLCETAIETGLRWLTESLNPHDEMVHRAKHIVALDTLRAHRT